MDVRLVPLALMAGIAVAVGTVAVYQSWWGLVLAAATTLALELVTPPGWTTRLPLAAGFVGIVALTAIPRGEGDYLVASTGRGYAVLGLALLVLCVAIATLPRPVRRQSDGKAPRE
jgi:CDP-diglyceride synthetase